MPPHPPIPTRTDTLFPYTTLSRAPARKRLRKRAATWLTRHIRAQLKPLIRTQEAELTPAGRGLLFQLVEALGTLPRRPLAAQIDALTKADRKALAELGVRLGAASLFMPKLQNPRSEERRVGTECVSKCRSRWSPSQ